MSTNASNLPLIIIVGIIQFLRVLASEDLRHDHILCRKCGNELSENFHENFVNITSPLSESINRVSVLGHKFVVVQSLRNPADNVFELVTVKTAGCTGVGEWYSEHTWFPGYSWKVCICPRCRAHLGWIFEPTREQPSSHIHAKASKGGFYGLILGNLISEDFQISFYDLVTVITVDCLVNTKFPFGIRVSKGRILQVVIIPSSYHYQKFFLHSDKMTSEVQVEGVEGLNEDYLAELEEAAKDRYTENDEDFMKVFNRPKPQPPIQPAEQFNRNRQGGRFRGGGQRHRGNYRDNWQDRQSGNYGRGRHGGYRDDRQSYGNYRDEQQNSGGYRDDRQSYGNYRDDRQSYGNYRDDRQSHGNYRDEQQNSGGNRDDRYNREGYRNDRQNYGGHKREREDDRSYRR